jgi:nicotinamidase-related amidase
MGEDLLPTFVDKHTFGSVNLPDVLTDLTEDVDQEDTLIEFCGLCTDICVVSNVLMTKAFLPEAQIMVHEKFCAGVTPESHAAAIATMKSCQIDII